MSFFIQVILPLALPQTFTYSVSEAEFDYLKVGMRVAVPFGKSKFYTGLVSQLHHNAPTLYEAKEIGRRPTATLGRANARDSLTRRKSDRQTSLQDRSPSPQQYQR